MIPYKPDGYNAVSPYFMVDGASHLIDRLITVFDAESLRSYYRPDNTIMHAEVKIDDSVLMFSDATEQYPPNKLLIHIYVKDVDKTYQKALDAGFEPLESPQARDGDPDKRGSFQDFAGNVWSIATQLYP